nr:hypothetical protein [Tanacetum cinerariifolium]
EEGLVHDIPGQGDGRKVAVLIRRPEARRAIAAEGIAAAGNVGSARVEYRDASGHAALRAAQ